MNQPFAQSHEYWVTDFAVSDSDIEQIYNHLIEAEQPQTAVQIAHVIIAHRVAEERERIGQLLSGRDLYQPKESYKKGDELVFPALRFTSGVVTAVRDGYDPGHGDFKVVTVEINGKSKDFASSLPGDHVLNLEDPEAFDPLEEVDLDELSLQYGAAVEKTLAAALEDREEFVRLGDVWFVKGLMAEVNIGHLHLAEAVLEMQEGGPLTTDEIMVHLDMDKGLDAEVRRFSLNYALQQDERFDEVGRPGHVAWFLQRMEPEAVRSIPERLRYTPISYDQAQLSPGLLFLERELDDEWSDREPELTARHTSLTLTYPHRWAGTLPLNAGLRPLFPTGTSPRQKVTLMDERSSDRIPAWIVQEGRYIYGLAAWYEENNIPVGGYVTLRPGPEDGVVFLDYDRRRPRREYVRLATVEKGRLQFEMERRSIGCGYDDLLIVGTDYVNAVDALARKLAADRKSLGELVGDLFHSLARLNIQGTVHTKTLYSAVNMLRRVPPGPLIVELKKHSGLEAVGDHYWQAASPRSR